ncbi:hypothetical protein FRZ67_16035 [Panacibacter ginsenosidivorans]|uniref:Uncharacterized protein n=1 Tax=Panacibacter ginsenosidivorans TaxID=1813871 RepID=A0A5B8VB81_9BACT|nr:hypothetical protein [Panacibacter ginsenosidivorans]QEC68740.1 hypothetical protein FRZ67_16035 [Panacibacter ginsenosidivorans]
MFIKIGDEKIGIKQYIPDLWRARRKLRMAVTAYYLNPSPQININKVVLLDVLNSRIIFFHGQVAYYGSNVNKVCFAGDTPTLNHETLSNESNIVLCMSILLDDHYTETIADSSIGILGYIFHPDIFEERIFYLFVDVEFEKSDAIYSSDVSIHVLPKKDVPIFNQDTLVNAIEISNAILKLDGITATKVAMSHHWFMKSLNQSRIDSFLMLWFAIEILATSSTNISEINTLLSKNYNLPLLQTQNHFAVGKLFGMRSKIVHYGFTYHLDLNFLNYVRALYLTISSIIIGIPFKNYLADFETRQPKFEINTYLKNIGYSK